MAEILFNKSTNTKNEKLKSEFKDWTSSMTMHAIPNIIRTEYISLRIIWILAFLCSSALCCYLIVQSIQNYLQFDVTTKIRIIEQDSVTFPTITVCNANPFVTNESLKLVKDILKQNGIDDFTNSTMSTYFPSKINQLFPLYKFGRYVPSIYAASSNITDYIKKTFGYKLEDFIISCTFGTQDCNMTEWVWWYDLSYGNCFIFNSGYDSYGNKIPLKSISQTGKLNGLSLELFVNTPEDRNTFSTYTGAHIFIHNDSYYPITYEGIDVPTGLVTNLHLERLVREQLPRPYSECVDNLDSIDSYSSSLYKEILMLNRTYSQKDCFLFYLQKNLIEKCKCYDPSVLNPNYPKSCSTLMDFFCEFKYYIDMVGKNYKSDIKEICPLECSRVEYKVYSSSGNYPSKSYSNDLVKSEKVIKLFNKQSSDITKDDLKESLLGLNLFYDDLKQTEITEAASLTIDILISGIGGTLGLFLGVSVLSLFEFVEIFLRVIFILYDFKKNK